MTFKARSERVAEVREAAHSRLRALRADRLRKRSGRDEAACSVRIGEEPVGMNAIVSDIPLPTGVMVTTTEDLDLAILPAAPVSAEEASAVAGDHLLAAIPTLDDHATAGLGVTDLGPGDSGALRCDPDDGLSLPELEISQVAARVPDDLSLGSLDALDDPDIALIEALPEPGQDDDLFAVVPAAPSLVADTISLVDAVLANDQGPEVPWTAPEKSEAQDVDPAGKAGTVSKALEPTESDILSLPGAGPGLVWMLQRSGVQNLADLAAANPATLRRTLGLVGELLDIDWWIAVARQRVAGG